MRDLDRLAEIEEAIEELAEELRQAREDEDWHAGMRLAGEISVLKAELAELQHQAMLSDERGIIT